MCSFVFSEGPRGEPESSEAYFVLDGDKLRIPHVGVGLDWTVLDWIALGWIGLGPKSAPARKLKLSSVLVRIRGEISRSAIGFVATQVQSRKYRSCWDTVDPYPLHCYHSWGNGMEITRST